MGFKTVFVQFSTRKWLFFNLSSFFGSSATIVIIQRAVEALVFELVAPPLEQIYTKPTYGKGGFCSGSGATELSKPTPLNNDYQGFVRLRVYEYPCPCIRD